MFFLLMPTIVNFLPIVLLHGYWHHHDIVVSRSVHQSVCVCLSVCNAVHCGFQAGCRPTGLSCTSVFLASKFLFVPWETFAVVCII